MERPEEQYASPREYFQGETLAHYARSKSMMRTQEKITERALELLELPMTARILDLGSGAGFSSIYLREIGYEVVAIDLIPQFLEFYNLDYLNQIASDMCYLPFRENTFDAAISISALQWIYRDPRDKRQWERLKGLFTSLERSLKPRAKTVFQFYPKDDFIMKSIGELISKHTSFEGNFIIDNPDNPVKRKIFLYLKKE